MNEVWKRVIGILGLIVAGVLLFFFGIRIGKYKRDKNQRK